MSESDDTLEVPADFDSFYVAHWAPVAALAYTLCGSRPVAEELAQDAFTAVYRDWQRVSRLDRPDAWVRRVASNAAISVLRRRDREKRARLRLAAGPDRGGDQRTVLPAEHEHFWAEVRRLPTRQAQAVALHYLEDRSVGDIAAVLDCAESTVKVHLHRGRSTLAERLGPHEEVTR
ncbi:MAG: sigma-70 family RNA polymerase sigma factor [Acidimicrobiales bacterium]|nr:sigma-70 family RNA polymerase sigma factor [Acidimicrobiales bacterium]